MESRPTDLFQPGELVNNTYRIEELLGRGGTSDVYKARSEISGRLVALKVLKAEFSGNDDYLVLLRREEEIREVRHDAVLRYSENHRTAEGHVYLLMDYVDGPGMDKLLREGPMPADALMTVCRRVAAGLQAAHARNIVHRDLSPDNIILRDGDPAEAVIIDFGIAKDANPGAETIVGNEFAGKYAYAAPEQLDGRTDARTDIYSLGASLLANFRGKSPDVGKNPMEVIQRKSEPLDTSDVPEPLKSVIDRATHPDPDQRFQDAGALLAYLDNPGGDMPPGLDDATIIAPVTTRRADPTPAPSEPVANPEPAKSRGGLIAASVVALLALVGVGGYLGGVFDALLGPSHPPANPYTLRAEKASDSSPLLLGHAPDEEASAALAGLIESAGGQADITLASGDIADSWSQDVMAALQALQALESWAITVTGMRATVRGETTNPEAHETVMAVFSDGPPGALDGTVDIALRPMFLDAAEIRAAMGNHSDCGPLDLINPPVTGYGPDATITIQGSVAETATRVLLFDELRAMGPDRQIVLDLNVLNPTLCLIESYLPAAPPGGFGIEFSDGDRGEPNPSGRFFVGENPVIDVVVPESVKDGYVYASVLDVSGNVFHLLPNLKREQNDVATLRDGVSGPVRIRVAYEESMVSQGHLGFRVDASALGKSKVIVLHSSSPLFDGLRPTAESAEGYAQALQDYATSDAGSILSLDSRVLETAEP